MCAEARANGPLRPTIGGITWAAAAVWLGVAASESIGAGLARDAALVRVGVACALCLFVAVLSRSRPTIALVAMGAIAGLCVGCAFWVRLDQAAARAAQRGSSSWRVEVVEDARVGTFGATSRCRGA